MEYSKMATSRVSKIKKTYRRKPYLLNQHQFDLLYAFTGQSNGTAATEDIKSAKLFVNSAVDTYTLFDVGQETTNLVRFDHHGATNYAIINVNELIEHALEDFNDGLSSRYDAAATNSFSDFDILRLRLIYDSVSNLQTHFRRIYTRACRLNDTSSPIHYEGSTRKAQSIIAKNTHALRDLASTISAYYNRK